MRRQVAARLPGVLRRCMAERSADRFPELAALSRELQAARLSLPPVGPIELGRLVAVVMRDRPRRDAATCRS